ncbi:hypothetical protein BpHYR1_036785 [Brachionus plicatilis]|uniref:Uncharacterized protein n=1 Tax=Brachionus plicatilis TaxID=10195 RepID=A0A3M7PS34_BRAPC|nr:hypothetical protein BpHYR1_036785 [Brachionus plicatilis]
MNIFIEKFLYLKLLHKLRIIEVYKNLTSLTNFYTTLNKFEATMIRLEKTFKTVILLFDIKCSKTETKPRCIQ